ncbi:DUF1259 domain-containing protein [Bacillus sp. REN3]|uniref:DUF1259 domain-containing protein n=1 Tax=Bacillus sp. REN3 TaxID=2802440 RepID=UPI001AEE578C|nr:DUF1259 domain-containing protein [Bacillus sp. REN3]
MRKLAIGAALLLALFVPQVANAVGQGNCDVLKSVFKTEVESGNGICKVEIGRESIQATHMGKKMSPEAMELVFHMSFEKVGTGTAVMGELALLEEEVNPVIDELRKGRLEISAVHNHMLHEQPRIMYVHFQGIGNISQQAETIKRAIDRTSK